MPGQTIFFILAAVAILSAFGVIFNKNVVHSALSLLVNFSTLAVLYFTLNAQFLGIAQVLVYAGAIVVLFLFVVMLVGADVGEPFGTWMSGRNIFLGSMAFILVIAIGGAVLGGNANGASGDVTQDAVNQFGQTEVIAAALFTEYLLPFQLVAVLLSVGVIGVVWLAQHQQRQHYRQVIAVLDSAWEADSQRVDVDRLRVNWLKQQREFDFDWVEIEQASDEDIERFMAQIGNDIDEWRQSRYPQMKCYISPAADLSENSIRILRHIFGEVIMTEKETA